jgi:hypothetical protein
VNRLPLSHVVAYYKGVSIPYKRSRMTISYDIINLLGRDGKSERNIGGSYYKGSHGETR